MSSLFRARRSDAPRSGCKIHRGRRITPSPSPYARPESSPSPAPPQIGSPSWLSGLISGSGKLISSVLPSYRSSSSSPSTYSSDEEEFSSGDDEANEGIYGLQIVNKSELVNNCMDEQLAIVPKSESKLAIEQLLMQETFSRDECDKLTRLIQSRVVDYSSPELLKNGIEELRSRTTDNDKPQPETLLPLEQKRTQPERILYSSSKTNAFYPESSVFEACTPDACKKAVMEARKWLQEKKSASKPKYDPECGPCTLNTDMLRYDTESEGGSPVDVAKSYMMSLPPWRSPSFGGIGFRTPPSTGMHCYKDGTSYITANNSLLSKVLKRDHLVVGSLDTLDEARRVRQKSIDDKLEISSSKQINSISRVSEHRYSKGLLEADIRELCVKDLYSDGAFSLPDKKDDNVNYSVTMGHNSSNGTPMRKDNILGAMHLTNEKSVPSTLLNPTQHIDENQPLQTVEEANNISVCHDKIDSAFRVVENDGVPSSVMKIMPGDETKLDMPSDVRIPELFDVHTSNVHSSTGVEGEILGDSFSQMNSLPSRSSKDCNYDSKEQDGNPRITDKSNRSINENSSNGSSSEFNTCSGCESQSKETNTTNRQNGTRMKSIERMLTEPQQITTRRGKRVAVKSRRGRNS